MSSATHDVEVAIVGGGPAGAALAIRLASAGRDVALFERLARPRWRASGVYSSPLTRVRLRALGLPEDELQRLMRPISAMVVETADGRATCRLDYPAPHHACGLDRVRLEEALLDLARQRGAGLHEGAVVRQVHLGRPVSGLLVSHSAGASWWKARLVVGADGPSSIVARAAGVALATRRYRRAAITGHRADVTAAPAGVAMDARMIVGRGWYLGLAPVPDGRINLGLVLGERDLRHGVQGGDLEGVMDEALSRAPRAADLRRAASTDRLEAHLPLIHRVARLHGAGFVLVGDAGGFIDPLSGEGLHRALVSAELAADAIDDWLRGDAPTLAHYERRLRARFSGKDVLSWLLQLFLVEPRLAGLALANMDRRPRLRRTFALALADLVPSSRVLDPRFVARLLAP